MAEVIGYLRYLRDFARKILLRRGFENVLKGTARAPHCYLDLDNWSASGRKWSAEVRAHLMHRDGVGRGIFVGCGLIVGRCDRKGRAHRVAAPMWFCPAELDESPRGWSIPDWDQFQFNYDLLTLLLGSDEPDEETVESIGFSPLGNIIQADLDTVSDLENQAARDLVDEFNQNRMLTDNEMHRTYFEKLRRQSNVVRSAVKNAPSVFSLRQLSQLLDTEGLSFFPKRFLFAATVPSDLSTCSALKTLVHQIEGSGNEVGNDLLKRILNGVLHGERVALNEDLRDPQKTEDLVGLLPISLSDPQREAVMRAWRGELSYIQGPPGTGKSHTITAVLLLGLLLGKRMLLVSHKRAALTVVREKLKPLLGANTDVVYLGDDPDARQQVKNFLQSVAQRAQRHSTEPPDAIPKSLLRLKSQRDDWMRRLEHGVDSRRQHALAHEDFVKERLRFEQDYPQATRFDFARVIAQHDDIKFRRIVEMFEHLIGEEKVSKGGMKRGQILILRRWLAELRQKFNADPARTSLTLETAIYAKRLETLIRKYQCAIRLLNRLGPDLIEIRKAVANIQADFESEAIKQFAQWYSNLIHQRGVDRMIDRFQRLFYARDPRRIAEIISQIDYTRLLSYFPIWIGEMRHLGNYLPFLPGMFDMVVVDEASQVNIAEILPAFYRGQRFCIVGDKRQLGLNAAGLFTVNRSFENLIWNQHFPNMLLAEADARALVASKHSILDFATHPEVGFTLLPTVLREHYRSMPQLALFTNKEFYEQDGGLDIMTETPSNILAVPSFEFKETGGQRDPVTKIVKEEITHLRSLLRALVYEEAYLSMAPWNQLGFTANKKPTIGILVFLSNHRNAIREDIEDLIPDADLWREFNLMIGTPEEFQGNERDIVFMLLCLDGTSRWGSGHYQEERRFNVATSRAIKFTYVIAGGIPSNASRIKRYLRHFGRSWANLAIDGEEVSAAPPIVRYDWKFSRARIESEFENRVAEELERFCEKNAVIKLFNQVPAGKGIPVCGEKRLDFVLYNPVTQHAVAVEVDGLHHFEDRGKTYAEEHIERVAALRRAGWRIVHIPYYDWYQHGWLCDREVGFEERVIVPLFKRLCAELDLPLN